MKITSNIQSWFYCFPFLVMAILSFFLSFTFTLSLNFFLKYTIHMWMFPPSVTQHSIYHNVQLALSLEWSLRWSLSLLPSWNSVLCLITALCGGNIISLCHCCFCLHPWFSVYCQIAAAEILWSCQKKKISFIHINLYIWFLLIRLMIYDWGMSSPQTAGLWNQSGTVKALQGTMQNLVNLRQTSF